MNETFIPPELQEVIVGTPGKVPGINRRVCRMHVPYAFGWNPRPHPNPRPLRTWLSLWESCHRR